MHSYIIAQKFDQDAIFYIKGTYAGRSLLTDRKGRAKAFPTAELAEAYKVKLLANGSAYDVPMEVIPCNHKL